MQSQVSPENCIVWHTCVVEHVAQALDSMCGLEVMFEDHLSDCLQIRSARIVHEGQTEILRARVESAVNSGRTLE